MQSHNDWEANRALSELRKRAEELSTRGENLITAGTPNERVQWERERGGFVLRQLPDDPLCDRISIGEVRDRVSALVSDQPQAYLVFRGDRATITVLLERALNALRGA